MDHQHRMVNFRHIVLEHAKVFPKIKDDSDISSFQAIGVSWCDLLDSDKGHKLMNALKEMDNNKKVYIFISQLNRIGVVSKTIKTFLERARRNPPPQI